MVSLLPVKPFTVKKAARVWEMSEKEARKVLERLAEKALLVDFQTDGEMH